jgi:hypothetical protein
LAWPLGGVAPPKPTLATTAAAHIAAIVSARIPRGVSQLGPRVCNHVRKPVATDVAAIAQPMHMAAA